MGSALGYLIHQGQAVRRFLDDAALPLDNSIAERALRIIALGRKNCLFPGHDAATQTIAVLPSLISARQLHGVSPKANIADLLVRTQPPAVSVHDLMPWSWKNANL